MFSGRNVGLSRATYSLRRKDSSAIPLQKIVQNRIYPCTQYKFNLETKEGRGLPMPYLDISILVLRDKESNLIRLLHHLYSN